MPFDTKIGTLYQHLQHSGRSVEEQREAPLALHLHSHRGHQTAQIVFPSVTHGRDF